MEKHNQKDEIVIDLRELIIVAIKKIWMILAIGISAALITFLLSKYAIKPKYKSTTQIYVMNKQNENSTVTYTDLQSSTQLTKDYMILVTSRPVVEQVIAELNLNIKYKDIVDLITVENQENTRILAITVEYSDPYLAKQIADAIRIASANHIKNVMNIDQVNLVEEANIPTEPSFPNIKKYTVLGGVLGVVITVIIICTLYILDDTIKTPDDVEKYLGLSVLSSIPIQAELNEHKKKKKKDII